MAIKSILVHVANDPRHSDRLELAVDLCRQVQGHLDVVFTTSPITMPAAATGRAASTVFLAEARDIAMRRVEALQADVAAHFSGLDLSYDFVVAHGDPVKELANRAGLADLVIIGQCPVAFDDHVTVKKMETLVNHVACPLLVLPFEGYYAAISANNFGQNAMIAWDQGMPAMKAIRGALPLLQNAANVTIVTNQPAEGEDLGGVGLGRYLSLHGVHADIQSNIDPHHDIADQLLLAAKSVNSDLLVMGAFGGLTLIEHLLGGVTEHVLERAHLPVLLAH